MEAIWRRIHASSPALCYMSVMVAMVMFLVSSAEDLGCSWEMSHSHRWGPIGSTPTFCARVSSWGGQVEWIINNVQCRRQNIPGHAGILCCRPWDGIALGCVGKCAWGVAVFVPIPDHRPPVRGSVTSELCHNCPGKGCFTPGLCCLLGQAVDCPLLGDNKEREATSGPREV